MDKLIFNPIIDVPLVIVSVGALLWNFSLFAKRPHSDCPIDLQSRLPKARFRVIGLFSVLLIVFFMADIAVWIVYAILLGTEVVVAMFFAEGAHVGGTFLIAVGFLIREWAFGFPQVVLHPPTESGCIDQAESVRQESVGKAGVTTTALKPIGEVEIDGVKYVAVSDDGTYVDAGVAVVVYASANGQLHVRCAENVGN